MGTALEILKKRYIQDQLIKDITIVVASGNRVGVSLMQAAKKSLLITVPRFLLTNADMLCYIIISEILSDTELAWMTIYQTEGMVYLLALPVGLLVYERINMKKWELLRHTLITVSALGLLCLLISTKVPWVSFVLPFLLVIFLYGGMAYNWVFQACANILKIEYEEYAEGNGHLDRKSQTIAEPDLQSALKDFNRKFSTGILSAHFGIVPLHQIPSYEPQRRLQVLRKKVTLVLKEMRNQRAVMRGKYTEKYPRVSKDGGFKKGDYSSSGSDEERIPSKEILGESEGSDDSYNSKSMKFVKDETFKSKEHSRQSPRSLEDLDKNSKSGDPVASTLKPTLKKGTSLFQEDFDPHQGTSNRDLMPDITSPGRDFNTFATAKSAAGAPGSMNFGQFGSSSFNYQGAGGDKEADQTLNHSEDPDGVKLYNPLDWPADVWSRTYYVVCFPVNLVLFFLFPNIAEPPSAGKIAVVLVVAVACTAGIVLLLLVIQYSLLEEFGIKLQVMSTFNAFLFVFPRLHDILTRARAIQDLAKRAHYVSGCLQHTILRLTTFYPFSQIWALVMKGKVKHTIYSSASLVFLLLLIAHFLLSLLVELVTRTGPWNKRVAYVSLSFFLLFLASVFLF